MSNVRAPSVLRAHPHPEDLERFALRKLERHAAYTVAVHVLTCEECRSRLIQVWEFAERVAVLRERPCDTAEAQELSSTQANLSGPCGFQ
jgi:hypothetical protein